MFRKKIRFFRFLVDNILSPYCVMNRTQLLSFKCSINYAASKIQYEKGMKVCEMFVVSWTAHVDIRKAVFRQWK